jgi:hypothetical protein
MHNTENMVGGVLELGLGFAMAGSKTGANLLRELSKAPSKAEGHIVKSVQASRRLLNQTVAIFEAEMLAGSVRVSINTSSSGDESKLDHSSHIRPLDQKENKFFAILFRATTLTVSVIYSRERPTICVRASFRVLLWSVFIQMFLLSVRKGFVNGKKWRTKSIYTQDLTCHVANFLDKFKIPLIYALEEWFEASFQLMGNLVEEKRSQHVLFDEAIQAYWSSRTRKFNVKQGRRSAVSSSFVQYPIPNIFIGWCLLLLHPMSAVNLCNLLLATASRDVVLTFFYCYHTNNNNNVKYFSIIIIIILKNERINVKVKIYDIVLSKNEAL